MICADCNAHVRFSACRAGQKNRRNEINKIAQSGWRDNFQNAEAAGRIFRAKAQRRKEEFFGRMNKMDKICWHAPRLPDSDVLIFAFAPAKPTAGF
jgi:hypothetical protein